MNLHNFLRDIFLKIRENKDNFLVAYSEPSPSLLFLLRYDYQLNLATKLIQFRFDNSVTKIGFP
jgi:hypothetical protein